MVMTIQMVMAITIRMVITICKSYGYDLQYLMTVIMRDRERVEKDTFTSCF